MFSVQPQHKLAITTLPKTTGLSTKTHTFLAKKNLNRTEFSAEHTYSQPKNPNRTEFPAQHKRLFFSHEILNRTKFSANNTNFCTTQTKQNRVLSQKHICLATTFRTERIFRQSTHIFNHKIPNRTKFSTKNMYFQPKNSKQNRIAGQKNTHFQPQNRKQNEVFNQEHQLCNRIIPTEQSFQ